MEKVAKTSERLKEAMQAAGKKQVDLVRDLDLNRSAVSRYVSGEYEPKQEVAMKLSAYLGVAEMWLWGYDVPRERPLMAKKNDKLAELIVRMRRDPEFFEVIEKMASLSSEDYEMLKHLLGRFGDK